jgi:Bacterial antitoxin of type II TA system, VapB
MAKEKVTITIDRAKAALALEVSGARSTSEVVDLALDQLIRTERLRSDIAAYQGSPPTADEVELALLADTSGLADDTDWELLYAEDNRS